MGLSRPVLAAPEAAPGLDIYSKAVVTSVTSSSANNAINFDENTVQPAIIEVKIISGAEKGRQVKAQYEEGIAGKLQVGDKVVINNPNSQGNYYVVDPYRLNYLLFFILLFFAVAIYFGHKRGIYSILGLVISVLIIFYYLIPQIIAGGRPLIVSLIAALLISVISLFVAHGFSKRTTIAFVSTIISLAIAVFTDLVMVYVSKLTGTSSEEALYLRFGNSPVDFQGILLGGILIGVLGILDDITTAQTAAVEEIHQANQTLSFADLYRRGLSVGREHIVSLINTLVLAYVGVFLPMILLLVSSKGGSLWVVMNSGLMAEEIVRTLVGSLVLVIAVPLTTFLAAYYYSKKNNL